MALAAPALWLLPEIATASSSSTTKGNNKTKDRPVDLELSAAVQKLFDLDKPNRLVPGRDYAIDVQGRKTSNENDAAEDPLFKYVDRAVFEDRPTYKAFVALLDNYQPNVCLAEDNTKDETEEAYSFLRACMATPPMKFCYSYCRSMLAKAQETEQASEDTATKRLPRYSFDTEEDFVQLIYKIWFQLYSRSKGCDSSNNDEDAGIDERGERPRKTVYGSSGFEHVFVGEIRKNKVIGFHNWIQLYRQETAGNLDYRGTVRGGAGAKSRLLTYNLRWNSAEKPIGGSLIGVSPEFELALYTMVFLVGQKDNILLLDLGDGNVNANDNDNDNASGTRETNRSLTKLDVKCFRTKGRVGSCYVESLS